MRKEVVSAFESLPEPFMDEEGFHMIGEGEKPDPNQIKEMEEKYQSEVRNQKAWLPGHRILSIRGSSPMYKPFLSTETCFLPHGFQLDF